MQGQTFKLQNEQYTNDTQMAVMGQAVPAPNNQQQQKNTIKQFSYQPQAFQQSPYPVLGAQNPFPGLPQQPQMTQPQYVSLPNHQIQQGMQIQQGITNPIQMPFPPQNLQPTSRYSQTLNCKNCRRPIETVINYEVGNGAYVVGGLMAAVGLWLGCCLIPCMMEDCKDSVHYCPNCGTQIGKKRFLFE